MIALRTAVLSEIAALTDISKRAFASDIDVGSPDAAGGPPGFDDPAWHKKMLSIATKFFSVYDDARLVGGILVFKQEVGARNVYNLGRIWIDPAVQHKGFGLETMDRLMEEFPQAGKWTLETPPWNKRTRKFYLKAGFSIVGEDEDDVFFEKAMP